MSRVFGAGGVMCSLGFLVSLFLPREHGGSTVAPGAGEQMLAAEMTTLEPDDEPVCTEDRDHT
jgi:hypothetical protein